MKVYSRKRPDAARGEGRQLAALAHDLRTPMCCVAGAAQMALCAARQGRSVDEQIQRILLAVQSMERLLAQTCDRRDAGAAERLTGPMLAHELHAMADAAAREKRQTLTIDLSALDGWAFWADAAGLARVLTNLLSNAIKYTPEGGRISLGCALASAKGARRVASFTVRDDGMGMSEAFLARMYEPFERAKESAHLPGKGLGLAIVRALVGRMHGEISVRSAPGEGTTFIVRVPVETAVAQ